MLELTIPPVELWDETREEFVCIEGQTITLEHSLVSLSAWESKWCKPFLSKEPLTQEQTIDYIKCMTVSKVYDERIYNFLTDENIADVKKYIEAPMTATTFSSDKHKGRPQREIITNEIIYFWMVSANIPVEFENWHLNRLLTLIRVCNIKSQPPKKRSRSEIVSQYAALNAARKQKLNTKG